MPLQEMTELTRDVDSSRKRTSVLLSVSVFKRPPPRKLDEISFVSPGDWRGRGRVKKK
jgi:hypothetical protein